MESFFSVDPMVLRVLLQPLTAIHDYLLEEGSLEAEEKQALKDLVMKLCSDFGQLLLKSFTTALLDGIERLRDEIRKNEGGGGNMMEEVTWEETTSRHLSLLLRAIGVIALSPQLTTVVTNSQITSTTYPSSNRSGNTSLLYLILSAHCLFANQQQLSYYCPFAR